MIFKIHHSAIINDDIERFCSTCKLKQTQTFLDPSNANNHCMSIGYWSFLFSATTVTGSVYLDMLDDYVISLPLKCLLAHGETWNTAWVSFEPQTVHMLKCIDISKNFLRLFTCGTKLFDVINSCTMMFSKNHRRFYKHSLFLDHQLKNENTHP